MTASELELARARTAGAPDAVLVEALLEQLGRTLDLRPPTNLHVAASYQHIKLIEEAELDWAGMLTPSPDGSFVITVRRSDRSHRKNFTIGHEITHTFLPGYTVVRHRCGGAAAALGFVRDGRLEALADVGAAELLLPRRYLGPIFADTPFRMSAIRRVADAHHASLDATLRQLLHLTARDGIFVDLRRTLCVDGTRRTAVHRVFSNSEWCPVAPSQLNGLEIPNSHPLSALFDSVEVDDVLDLSILRTTTRAAEVSAITDPYTDNEGSRIMRSLILATPRRAQTFIAASQRGRLSEAS